MVRKIFVLCGLMLCLSLSAQSRLMGDWYTVDDKTGERLSVMHFFKGSDGKYYGRVTEMCRPEDKGKTIRHGENKGKPVVGMVVFRDFEYIDGELVNGKAFNPDDGKWYYAKLWLGKDGRLMLRGGLDKRLVLGRTQGWVRKK